MILLDSHVTRDPFDTLLVGHAKKENCFLLTKDESILKHFELARW